MTALAVFVITFALVHPFVPASESTLALRDPESIPLVCDAPSTVIVPVSLPGAPLQRFVLDTGASLSIIDRNLADRLRLYPAGRIPSRSGSEALVTAQLTIGSLRLPSHPIVAADLAQVRRLMGNVAGILGADALRAMGAITIDYSRCALHLGGTRVRIADRVPLVWHEGRPVVAIAGSGRMLLDSGASTLMVKSWYDAAERNAPDGLLPLRLFSQVHINISEGYATFVK
jgi:hypothetical protein